MWSNKKWVDNLINILIFCTAINLFHYGQLILPFICLILFVENGYKFKINNPYIFSILCLFALTYCLFSYKLGLYCVIGFFLPMAYYIGSNLKCCSYDNIKKLLYIISLGMASHVLLNFAYNISIFGLEIFIKQNQYDIWTQDKISSTSVAVNYVFIICLMYYVLKYERDKKIKCIFSITFALMLVYEIALGRRTPIFILLIVSFLALVIDICINSKTKIKKTLIVLFITILAITGFITIIYYYIRAYINPDFALYEFVVFRKLINEGLKSGRLEILLRSIKIMPEHLWGGQEISAIIGNDIHDLWSDIYDSAGIIPFMLMMVYTILLIKNVINNIKNKIIKEKDLIIYIPLCVGIILQMMLEPMIRSCSIFLILVVLISAASESIDCRNEKQV